MTNNNNDIKIVRTQIEAKSRKLAASWTVDVETEIMTIMSQDIQREIDWEVLCELDPGRKNWIGIPFSKSARAAGDAAIEAWAKETFPGGYYVFSDRILFGRKEDAEFFMLRWS